MNSLLKKSKHKKLREKAENWLCLAEKIYHFRKDIIAEDDLKELHGTSATLNNALKKKGEEDWGKVRLASEELESVLKRVGGYFYPQSFWAENAEMFLVAAVVALAIRTFFLQPFKIPTNSMYPSYNGMTHEVYEPGGSPGGIGKLFRFISWGTVTRDVIAVNDGEVLIPLVTPKKVPGRKWLVFPTQLNEHTLLTGTGPTTFKVPSEFSPYDAFRDAFFPQFDGDGQEMLAQLSRQPEFVKVVAGVRCLRTGIQVNKGDPILSFAVHTGDALFVDRMSYHFAKPDVGEAIVFKTENIPNLRDNKYYIKRLVGIPGDELQVKAPKLYRNGELITGADAFDKNANQEGEYSGYSFKRNYDMRYLRSPEEKVSIPEDSYFAMGDNSPHSSDSRYWGFVPKQEMVGRAIFIYYPFTHRWGLAN